MSIYEHIKELHSISKFHFLNVSNYMDTVSAPIVESLKLSYDPYTDTNTYRDYIYPKCDCSCKSCRYDNYLYCEYQEIYYKYRDSFPIDMATKYYYELYYLQRCNKFLTEHILNIMTYLTEGNSWKDIFQYLYPNRHPQNICRFIQPVLNVDGIIYTYSEDKHIGCWEPNIKFPTYTEYLWYCMELPKLD